MPYIEIYQNNLAKQVYYELNDTPLKEILASYDRTINKRNTRCCLGKHLILDWSMTINVCLHYGEKIIVVKHEEPRRSEIQTNGGGSFADMKQVHFLKLIL